MALYPILAGVFYFFQNQILFHEKPLDQNYRYQFEGKYEEIWIPSTDGVKLNALHFFSEKPQTKGMVVYLHGNSDNLLRWAKHAPEFTRNGYDILIVDYRGFGKSKGKISEKGLIDDGWATFTYAKQQWPEDKIILYGRSLGSGIAAQIAAKSQPKMLILETPYTSLPDVGAQFVPFLPFKKLSKYQLNTEAIIGSVACAIHIFHGTADRLVFYESSLRLSQAKSIKPEQMITTLQGGGHKNLASFPKYHQALDSLLSL